MSSLARRLVVLIGRSRHPRLRSACRHRWRSLPFSSRRSCGWRCSRTDYSPSNLAGRRCLLTNRPVRLELCRWRTVGNTLRRHLSRITSAEQRAHPSWLTQAMTQTTAGRATQAAAQRTTRSHRRGWATTTRIRGNIVAWSEDNDAIRDFQGRVIGWLYTMRSTEYAVSTSAIQRRTVSRQPRRGGGLSRRRDRRTR